MVAMSAALLVLYTWLNRLRLMALGAVVMALIGLCISAADFCLPTLVAQDCARRVGAPIRGVGPLVGAINGCGSLGTVVQGPLVAYVSVAFGWDAVFWLLVGCCACCCAILVLGGPLRAEQREAAAAAAAM